MTHRVMMMAQKRKPLLGAVPMVPVVPVIPAAVLAVADPATEPDVDPDSKSNALVSSTFGSATSEPVAGAVPGSVIVDS